MTRHFTVEEANALLGRVRPLVERMVERRQELATELGRQQALGEIVRSNGGGFNPRLPAQIDEAVEAAAQELTICIEELTTLVVQVKDIDTGLVDFPPLRSLQTRATNLPVQPSSFIGREVEIQQVRQMLANTRLLNG